MNLSSVKERLLELGKTIGLQVHEETAQSIILHSQITARDFFESSIYCRLVVYASGTFHMFLTFDEIEKTYDNLFLINTFNADSPWFKAYVANINDKDFLELHYSVLALKTEDEIIDSVGFLLNNLLEEETLKNLRPILNNDK